MNPLHNGVASFTAPSAPAGNGGAVQTKQLQENIIHASQRVTVDYEHRCSRTVSTGVAQNYPKTAHNGFKPFPNIHKLYLTLNCLALTTK